MMPSRLAIEAPEKASLLTLDAAQFAAIVAKHGVHNQGARDLHLLFMSIGSVPATHAPRLAWIESLADWVHAGRTEQRRTERLQAFVHVLGAVKVYREEFARLFTGLVSELRGTKLFADVGIPVEPGFWRESVDRLSRRFLPTPPAPKSFIDFISAIFPTRTDAEWLEHTPVDAWRKLWNALEVTSTPLSSVWMPLAASMSDAMRILAVRVAALGVAQDIRDRIPEIPVASLPFLRLPTLCDSVQIGPPRLSMSNEGALSMIDECRATLKLVHRHVEEYGVSVDLVYRLELMSAQLTRLEQLVALLVPASQERLAQNLGRFARDLVRAQFQSRSILELVSRSSHVLARKVVERSGKTGEHYITKSRAEWRTMLLSAAGGGFLTCFTAAGKVLVAKLGAPLFITAMLNITNYAGSFLLMGFVGFTLATKQPSMTAAALVGTLEEAEDEGSIERLVTLIAQIARSQLAAAIGNVGCVIPVALIFAQVWRLSAHHPFLTPEKAIKVVDSLHPFKGGMLPYAALTGVLLWMASIAAGWFENWITYRRLPEAIATNRRCKKLLGPERAKRWAKRLDHDANSMAGSVSLGFLLGFVPMLGTMFALPLDVRHVTLSTGSLVFAGCALGVDYLHSANFLGASLGILVIGALNFGVSFVLALGVALRARNHWRAGTWGVLKSLATALGHRLVKSPLEFVFPPKQ